SRRIDNALTLLPQPDSPTSPSVSPSCTSYVTPSTAWTTPSSVLNCVLKLRTCSSGAIYPPLSRAPVRRALRSTVSPHAWPARASLMLVGKRRLELLRLAARDPKSRSSANSDTSPRYVKSNAGTWPHQQCYVIHALPPGELPA